MSARMKVKDESANVRKLAHASTIKSLGGAGAYIRGIAARSIAKRPKGKTSAPGRQPFTHTGALKQSIKFEVDKAAGNVVIGPTATGIGNIGAIHEFGANVGADKLRRAYKLGEVGPIDASGARLESSGKFSGAGVSWTVLRSPAMVSRANRIASNLPIGKGGLAGPNAGQYPPRPFMRPAFERGRERLPAFWKNSIRGN